MDASFSMPSSPARKPNWLLRGLVLISLVVHGVIFVHVSGIYRSTTLTYIEMTLQDVGRPEARDIPRPRMRPKPPEPGETMKKINVVQQPIPQFKPLAVAPVEKNLPDSLVEGISAPDVPTAAGVEAASWVTGAAGHEAAGADITTASYLDRVRMKIERHKRYPQVAKARGVEGRVLIRFVLCGDGTVRDLVVLNGARHASLDAAALDAVRRAAPFPRPPADLFKGDVPLELAIVFELN